MKSPLALMEHLARQWQRADWRERHILQARDAWPLRLPIGAPSARQFRDEGPVLVQHLDTWRAIAQQGLGTLQWHERRYQAGAVPVQLPAQWVLERPSQLLAAIETLRPAGHAQLRADWSALQQLLGQVDARFHRLLLRRPTLWRDLPCAQVVAAARLALQLAPGCAAGRPLRALAVDGNDSKFFERHAGLVTALLDVLYEGEASRRGLAAFLGAGVDGDHWLLLCSLAPDLLPFERLRVPASELQRRALPARATHVLLVENERCLHLLPRPLAGAVAILGAGLDLAWLCAPWLRERRVAYWGDIDTWGLAMLACARGHLPGLRVLLMDAATFERHAERAVAEPVRAPAPEAGQLPAPQAALFEYLQGLERGRLEQEFLEGDWVRAAVEGWVLGRA